MVPPVLSAVSAAFCIAFVIALMAAFRCGFVLMFGLMVMGRLRGLVYAGLCCVWIGLDSLFDVCLIMADLWTVWKAYVTDDGL